MADAKIRAVITADNRASGVLRTFDDSLGKIGHTVGNILKKGFLAASAAVAGFTAFAWKSIEAFAEEETAVARLSAGIRNVTSATDKNIDALLEQASALQATTRFADEAVISAQGILTTFQLNQEAILALTPRLIDMAEGVARVSGELPDLEGNAMLVAKAIGGEDVEGMVGALRRVGVIMTEHQMEVLKTGSMQERLSTVTKVLDQNFNDLGDAIGQTTAGKIAILKNTLGDLQEQFGAVLAQAITPFIEKLTKWARTDEAKAAIERIANRIVELGTKIFTFLRDNWPQIKQALKDMAGLAWGVATALAFIVKTAKEVWQWLMKVAQVLPGFYNAQNIRQNFRPPTSGSFQMGGRVAGGCSCKSG